MPKMWIALVLSVSSSFCSVLAQVETDIKGNDRTVSAFLMGEGDHVVIALHGGSGTNRGFFFSPCGGQMGRKLANAGFRVIAVTWPGRTGTGFIEVGTAIAHARETGARKISLMGHSRGGELAADYARAEVDGTFDTVIEFSSVNDKGLPMTKTKKLFAFNKNDPHARWQPTAFEKSADPKQKIELGGGGHCVGQLIVEKADLVRDVVRLLRQ